MSPPSFPSPSIRWATLLDNVPFYLHGESHCSRAPLNTIHHKRHTKDEQRCEGNYCASQSPCYLIIHFPLSSSFPPLLPSKAPKTPSSFIFFNHQRWIKVSSYILLRHNFPKIRHLSSSHQNSLFDLILIKSWIFIVSSSIHAPRLIFRHINW